MSPVGLFTGDCPRVRAALPGADMLALVVEAMRSELHTGADPFALADALILVPNRRSIPALISAFAAAGHAGLLPAIRPLGDIEDDPDVWGAEPLDFDLLPAIDPLRRRLELARLVRAKDQAETGFADPARALAVADDLCRLLDSAAAGGGEVEWGRLDGLVADQRFAQHWEKSLQFLRIVTQIWPQHLAQEGLADPAQRRHAVLEHLAARWRATPPSVPILILGSTGSVAGVRALMGVVASLPKGCVLLPGLDGRLDDAAWAAIDAQHPQFALKKSLEALGMHRKDIPIFGEEALPGQRAARRVLMREALAPADATADWLARLHEAGGADFAAQGAQGLTLIEAASPDEEADCVALLLREALETPGQTAALVTPDMGLARRVEAKLAPWGLSVSASGGHGLQDSPRGVLLALLVQLCVDEGDPLALAGLITHPLANFGIAAQTRADQAASLLGCLRGPRRHGDWQSLMALVGESAADLMAAIGTLREALRLADAARVDLSDWARRLSAATQLCAGEEAFVTADGEAAASLLRGLAEHGQALGPCEVRSGARLINVLMRGQVLANAMDSEPRLAIWGPLEARLQTRDLLILGGLNEGVWPGPPPEDGLLNRAMRAQLGLPPPEARLGLAAHDFAQLACAPRVVFTRTQRSEGAPKVASRWLWRLLTLLKGAGMDSLAPSPERDPRHWARALHMPEAFQPARPPAPRPPLSARPRTIAITDVELLIRDPYAYYAKRILRLKPLDLIGIEAGARERGIALHKALELSDPAATAEELLECMLAQLGQAGFRPERLLEERARLALAAQRLADWCQVQAKSGAQTFREAPCLLDIEGVRLHGRADRIDLMPDGAQIVDFKSGSPPSHTEVQAGLAPQLCLEAAILARGGFAGLGVQPCSRLIYWALSGRDPHPRDVKLAASVTEAGEQALGRLTGLMRAYGDAGQAYLCKPRLQFATKYTDYDQLARRGEWSGAPS